MRSAGERVICFIKNFAGALGHCAADELGLIPLVFFIFLCLGVVLLFAGALIVAYELITDPNSVDVSARLASLSIDPGRWI